jgi:hypothetical protein
MNPIRVLVVDSVVPGFSGMHTLDLENRTISWDLAAPGSDKTVAAVVEKLEDGTITVHEVIAKPAWSDEPPPFPEVEVMQFEPTTRKKSWRQQQRELPRFLR